MMQEIKIRSNLKELYGLLVLHDYYDTRMSGDLTFRPTYDTSLLLKNYSLAFKPNAFGFLLLYHAESTPDLMRKDGKALKLSFIVENQNPKFANFTDIPFLREGQGFHFSNKNTHKEKVEVEFPDTIFFTFKNIGIQQEERNLLNAPSIKPLNLNRKQFYFTSMEGGEPQPTAYKDLKIVDLEGKEEDAKGKSYKLDAGFVRAREVSMHLDRKVKKLRSEDISEEDIKSKIPDLTAEIVEAIESRPELNHVIDLRHVPEGKYSVKSGKGAEREYYTLDNTDSRIFGVVDIFIEPPKEGEDFKPEIGYLKFNPRETIWRYHFLNHRDSIVEALEIEDENDGIEFSDPEEAFLEQMGKKCVTMIADKKITLKEKPEQIFWLRRKSGKRNLKDIKLPFASSEVIKPIKEKDSYRIYSDIYVYL